MLAPNPTVQALQAARNLIADEEKWCQGVLCITKDGRRSNAITDTKTAKRVCAVGALWCVSDEGHDLMSIKFPELKNAAVELFGNHPEHGESIRLNGPSAVNDRLGHAATLHMFDRAIQLAVAPLSLPEHGRTR